MAGNSARPGATVASRLLGLLGAFEPKHSSLTLSELAERAELPLATAHRLVGELVAWGALAVARSLGAYEIGQRIWDLGLLAPVPAGLRQHASPFLQDLYGATFATVHLAVRDGLQALYLDRLSGTDSVPLVSRVGARLPLHATGVGKVLLAYAPDEILSTALADLAPITRYTVTDPARLEQELRGVRRDGYAQTREEMSLGACSLAVPVRDRDGAVVAALGLTVSSLDRSRARFVAALNVAANGIRRSIGQRAFAQ